MDTGVWFLSGGERIFMSARTADAELEELVQGFSADDLEEMAKRMERDLIEIRKRICLACGGHGRCLLCARALPDRPHLN
jgi:hypothetical protein